MKNKFMRLAAIMLVLVLATSCFVGGTFAKYVTEGSGNDNARVALWGVTVTAAEGDGAFATTYAIKTAQNDVNGTAIENSVVTAPDGDGKDLVAPGTDGTFAAITVSGKPEVAVDIAYVATVELSDWEITVDSKTEYYCPIVVTIGEDELSGLDYEDAAKFATAIKEKIDGYSAAYQANTDLSTVVADELELSWAWAYEGEETDTEDPTYGQTDAKDTLLGDKGDDTISIKVEVTVTQID